MKIILILAMSCFFGVHVMGQLNAEHAFQVRDTISDKINIAYKRSYAAGLESLRGQVNRTNAMNKFKSNKGDGVFTILDSIISLDYNDSAQQMLNWQKFNYSYDRTGKLIRSVDHVWKLKYPFIWKVYDSICITYNSDGNVFKILWDDTYESTFTYDDMGRLISEINKNPIGSFFKKIENINKNEYFYDPAGNRVALIRSEWSDLTHQWCKSFFEDCIYDGNNRLLCTIKGDCLPNGGKRVFSRNDFTYNPNGTLASAVESYPDQNDTIVLPRMKIEYAYNADELEVIRLYYLRDQDLQLWDIRYKYDMTYHQGGKKASETYYEWYESLGKWHNWDKIEYEWDEYGNPVTETRFVTNNNTEILQPYTRFTSTYDNNVSENNMILPAWNFIGFYTGGPHTEVIIEDHFQHKLINHSLSSYYEGNWSPQIVDTYYYSIDTIVISPAGEGIAVFPNPATIHVSFGNSGSRDEYDLSLYNSLGQLVLSQHILNREMVYIDRFNAGFYFYKLIDSQNTSYTGKLCIQKP
jgi:hypothetical protein